MNLWRKCLQALENIPPPINSAACKQAETLLVPEHSKVSVDIAHLFTVITCITHTATLERGQAGEEENGKTPLRATRTERSSKERTEMQKKTVK